MGMSMFMCKTCVSLSIDFKIVKANKFNMDLGK